MTSPLLQKVMRQLADEHARLDEFVTTYDSYGDAKPIDKPAEFETTVVAIVTKNHGVFLLDQQALLKILTDRRDGLARELKDHTFLGENISKLRPQPTTE